jgi:hypothetical protein
MCQPDVFCEHAVDFSTNKNDVGRQDAQPDFVFSLEHPPSAGHRLEGGVALTSGRIGDALQHCKNACATSAKTIRGAEGPRHLNDKSFNRHVRISASISALNSIGN